MSSIVSEVLSKAAEAEARLASTKVEKPIELETDVGNMLVNDTNQLENEKLLDQSAREEYLRELAREGTQFIVSAIWQLPTERVDDVIVANFPPGTTRLPREKPLPKPKAMTKWEKYAKDKGIVKKKSKKRLAWDDVVKDWVPQFGYKKNKVEQDKNWLIPLKQNADPSEDPFKKMAEEKKERVAKNELQRLRNLARAKKVNVPTVGVLPVTQNGNSVKSDADSLKSTAELVKLSTASLGKFQDKLSKNLEKTGAVKSGKKRKFESTTGDANKEKEKNLGILDSISSKRERLNMEQAVGRQIYKEDNERSEEKGSKPKAKGGRKGRGGKGKRGKPHFANKGGKGKFSGKARAKGGKGKK